MAEAGATAVVFADMNEEWARESSQESIKYATNKDYQISVIVMNVQDAESVEAMVRSVIKWYGRLDYCVNAAGVSKLPSRYPIEFEDSSTPSEIHKYTINTPRLLSLISSRFIIREIKYTDPIVQIDNGTHAPLADTDIENFDRVMSINTRGNLLCVRAQAAAMRKQSPKTWTSRNGTRDIGRGVIINIGSANSFAGLPGKGAYTISKHASMGITKMAGMYRLYSKAALCGVTQLHRFGPLTRRHPCKRSVSHLGPHTNAR